MAGYAYVHIIGFVTSEAVFGRTSPIICEMRLEVFQLSFFRMAEGFL